VSYKAPQLQQIGGVQEVETGSTGAVDPFRGNEPVAATTVFGSNPNLKAETGNAFTLGFNYRSTTQPGLQVSLTYFAVNIANYIAQPDIQTLIDNPSAYPGAVVRAPPTSQDQQRGLLGPITQINDLFFNFGDLHVAGVDADTRYSVETRFGQMTPSLTIANIYKWQSALIPGTPQVNYVNQAGGDPGWAPRYKGTVAFTWKRGPVSANVAGRYVGPYKDSQVVEPNTNELGNAWFLDLNLRYEPEHVFGSGAALAGTYIALGAVDLLNKTPPFSYGGLPYDPSQYDIRGRYVYVHLGLRR